MTTDDNELNEGIKDYMRGCFNWLMYLLFFICLAGMVALAYHFAYN